MDVRLLWLALGAFAGSVESSLIVSVLPAIAAETGVSLAQAGYLIFGYSIAYGIGTPLLSTLFGHLDRRTVVAGAELLFGLMCLLLGVLPGFLLLVLARTFMALGAGLFTSTAQATAVALAAPGKRGSAISTVVMGGSIAVAVGVPAAALVAEFLGWRVAYLGLGVLAIIASATMWLKLPADIHGDRRTIRERLSVLRVPGMPLTLLTSGGMVMASFTFFNYLAPITTDLLGLERVLLPLVMFAFGIGAVFGNFFGGRLADRIGGRQTMLVIGGLMVVLLAAVPLLALLPRPLVLPAFLVHMALYGVVSWGFFPPQLHRLAALAPLAVPLSASLNLTSMNIGGALSALVGGLVLENLSIAWLGPIGAIGAVAALVIAYLAPDHR
ncbi:MFS transporter [Devosia sp.]|uniref:MFS transporter n=1 Tax=Devosia sp. TaxID=1871048 RepID=UPI003F72EB87